jgi:hypothetical protein
VGSPNGSGLTQKGQQQMNPLRKVAVAGALAVASITGGAIGAGFFGTANAATTSTSSTSSTSPTSSTATQTAPAMPAHGSAAHEDAETPVTGSAATQAQAAAVKSVGSGTAGSVTTDFTKTGYEVTVTKPDGSQVEVHLDSSFNVMSGPQG